MSKKIIPIQIFFLILFTAISAFASEIYVPPALSEWTKWIMHEKETNFCPSAYNSSDTKECFWPGKLEISVNNSEATFSQSWTVTAEGFVNIPGDAVIWPQNVTANNSPVAVTMQEESPSVRLKPGEYKITGNFKWSELPQRIKIPDSTGLVGLSINGSIEKSPVVDDSGFLWLSNQNAGKSDEKAENRMDVKIFRLFEDKTPMEVTTMIQVSVSGDVRRETLPPETLLKDSVPAAISSPLPLKIDEKGEIKFEARPGIWNLEIKSVIEKNADQAISSSVPFGPEIWTFKPHPELRNIKIEGGSPVDPTQTTMPEEWRGFSSYLLKKDEGLTFREIKRGSGSLTEGDLNLFRDLWLDFDGSGAVVKDQISGKLDRRFFLGLENADYRLGRVTSAGTDQLITNLDKNYGIEMEKGGINLSAVSRMDKINSGKIFPVGWNIRFQKAEGSIHIPPGWRLLAVSGGTVPDRTTWLDRWSLLDIFIVMIISVAVAKLWGFSWGLIFFAGLALIAHEPFAPKSIWIFITITAAISALMEKNQVRSDKAMLGIRIAHIAACLILAGSGIMFCYTQIRLAIYPQLDKPWINAPLSASLTDSVKKEMPKPQMLAKSAPAPAAPMPAEAPAVEADKEAMMNMRAGDQAVTGSGAMEERKAKFDYSLEPQEKSITQTGPGLPEWNWTSVPVKFGLASGTHKFALWLSPPIANTIAGFIRILLFLVLASRFININIGQILKPGLKIPQIAIIAALAILAPVSQSHGSDIPGPELLKELESRLLKPAPCFPECASVPHLKIKTSQDFRTAEITMDINAAIKTAIPLPTGSETWEISAINTEQNNKLSILKRDGVNWVLVNEGASRIMLNASLKSASTVRFSFPIKPMFVEINADGWSVSGLDENQQVQTELTLSRTTAKKAETEENLEETASSLKGYMKVYRTINMGLEWKTFTRVERLFQAGGPAAISADIPLINGEIVHNSKVKVKNGMARVEIGPGETAVEWNSSVPVSSEIKMQVPENSAWGEIWHANASSLWHLSSDGVPEVHMDGQPGTYWYPRQGETIILKAKKLEAAEGDSTTIDAVSINYHAGEEFSRIILDARIRTSQGGILPVKSPVSATLKNVKINGNIIPLGESSGKLNIPLQPGSQNLNIEWLEKPEDTGFIAKIFTPKIIKTPEINIGKASSNITVNMHLPEKMWLIFTFGPTLGPAVLFWGYLILVIAGAVLLGMYAPVPLKTRDWIFLGIGLAPLGPGSIIFAVMWFMAISFRDKKQPEKKLLFRLMQISLIVSTFIMAGIIYSSIKNGLLGIPNMQISGNGSNAMLLKWTLDKSGEILPCPSALMFSIYIFRLLMFAWAAWLALRITEWAKWAYAALRQGGVWQKNS